MKKGLVVIVSIILMVGVLAGCNSGKTSEGGSGSSNEKVTLNVALWDQTLTEVMNKTVEVYKKSNPNVEVNVTYIPNSDYWNKLQTSLTGNNGPDVFWMNYANFHKYASLGLIKDLEPLIQKSKFDKGVYLPQLFEMFSYKGKMMGLPYFMDSVGLFYNKELFDKAKVPYPTKDMTWESVKEIGRKLSDKQAGVYGYVADITAYQGMHNFIYQAGGYVINKEKTKSGYDLKETQDGLKFMKELMDEGISPSAKTQLETDAKQLFMSGKIAMYQGISTAAPSLHAALKDKLAVTEMPKGKKKAAMTNGISWAMNNKTKHEKAAWELLQVLSGVEGEKIMAQSGFSMSSHKNPEIQKIWVNSFPQLNYQVFVDSLEFGVIRPASKDTATWQKNENLIVDAFLGKTSIEEAANNMAQRMNEVLAKEHQ